MEIKAPQKGLARFATAALMLSLTQVSAPALDYPVRPITLVVSHRTGGPGDVIARVLGKMLGQVLHQPLVIENRPGAGGSIAAEQAAHAPADGYTLLLGTTGILASHPASQKNTGFDALLDFVPITLIGTQANVLVVNPSLPANSLSELIALAQARPGMLTFASSGHGSSAHLAGELFKLAAKADLVHVPYKKPGPALQDVVGGHVQMMFAPAALVRNHIRFGRLRAIAVATTARSAVLPAIPTMDELGLTGFDATTWYGLIAPAGTPKEIVDVLHHSTAAMLDDSSVRTILLNLGIDVVASTPRAFEAYLKTEVPKWAAVVRTFGTHTH